MDTSSLPFPNETSEPTAAVGVLLAAGRGSRFDPSGEKSKLLQMIGGLPVVCHTAANLLKACAKVVAVIRPNSAELKLWLTQAGCHVVECADAHSGMGHSLAWGIAEAERLYDPEVLVVMLGDMPQVKASTIKTLVLSIDKQVQAVAPEFMGRRGNPWVFGPKHFEALGSCRGDRGAAAVLSPEDIHLINVPDPGVLNDIDAPADLEAISKNIR
jgi:molybdenum cofactor cytidylyltransferase